ncbi:MAG: hypothetical protein AB1576_06000 [Bacillota bacterium]|jgi:riboflavin kinase/FMN adenylyltransferase
MRITRNVDDLGNTGKCVAMGLFDGVHMGHQTLVKRLVTAARGAGGKAVVLTFDPHPLEILNPAFAPPYLTNLEEKALLLEALGVDDLLVLAFDASFSRLSPEAFAGGVLGRIRPYQVFIGYNFTFGHKGLGTAHTLVEMGRKHSFEVQVVDPVKYKGAVVSSTLIRDSIGQGRVELANEMLGRAYTLPGVLGKEPQGGTSLGFGPGRALPGSGVYAVRCQAGRALDGVCLVRWPGPRILVDSLGPALPEGPARVTFLKHWRGCLPQALEDRHCMWARRALDGTPWWV